RGDHVTVLDSHRQLPVETAVENPERVGLDRLLNAVAANSQRPRGSAALIVDVGSAVTVDWVDEAKAFRGGAIFPGIRLMAKSLHDYTAALPLVELQKRSPAMPGTSTVAAIEAGVYWAVVGAIRALGHALTKDRRVPWVRFLTGGD